MAPSESSHPARPLGRDGSGQPPLADRLAGADGLFVGLDFDGTLAPIVDDPAAATVDPSAAEHVAALADRPDAAVAVISGRALADLEERMGVDGPVYAGTHGLELRRDGERVVSPAAERRRPAVRRAHGRVRDAVASVPGVVVEDKDVTFTVHVRGTPDEHVDEVRGAVTAAAEAADGDLEVVSGKEAFEIRPAVERDKGAVVTRLARETPARWPTVYLGDDTTDEDAFRAIRPEGIGVVVGPREETAAAYRIPDREDVARFLEWLRVGVLGPVDDTSG